MAAWLDCDTTPALQSRYSKHKRIDGAKRQAMRILDDARAEGQIGLYASAWGGEFFGYAIRYAGQAAYFEPAEAKA